MTTLLPLHFFAWAAIYALSCHFTEGPVALEQRIASLGTNDGAMDEALRPANLAAWLVFAVLLGPIIEEVVFRAFLFRAWERRFGWFASMILTSTVFGLLHPNFIPAFVASSVYACLYRRTGSLHAPIIAHAAGNLLAMYPMLGRWVFPRDLHAPGDLQSWMPQIACLLVVLVLWPAYIWMTFEERNGDFPVEDDHVPLPR